MFRKRVKRAVKQSWERIKMGRKEVFGASDLGKKIP